MKKILYGGPLGAPLGIYNLCTNIVNEDVSYVRYKGLY